jgi:carbon storage regulator
MGEESDKEGAMLVLSRRKGEAIRIAATVEIAVLEIRGGQVKLGISGPPQVKVHREEVYRRINHRRGHCNGMQTR